MNKLENKLSSREVAPMMDIDHANLLKKIDKISEDFEKSKVTFQKYWTESIYKVEGNNKSYREFEITQRGCEFLAHKMTGTKGNLFTDRYMDRFEQMKEIIEEDITHKVIDPNTKEKEIEARYNNSLVRKANLLLKIAETTPVETYKQVLQSKATEILNDGQALIPLPKSERKTYSATEIGSMLGITANKVGKLANSNNLKTGEYGELVWDKSKYSAKEVQSFRYYEEVIPVLKGLI